MRHSLRLWSLTVVGTMLLSGFGISPLYAGTLSFDQLMVKAQKTTDKAQKSKLLYEAIDKKPQASLPYTLLGEMALDAGDLEEAQHQYTRSLMIESPNSRAERGLVKTYLAMAQRANKTRLANPDPNEQKDAKKLEQILKPLLGDTP